MINYSIISIWLVGCVRIKFYFETPQRGRRRVFLVLKRDAPNSIIWASSATQQGAHSQRCVAMGRRYIQLCGGVTQSRLTLRVAACD